MTSTSTSTICERAQPLPEWFLVAPHYERKSAARHFYIVSHRPSPWPATLFVESCGPIVADCARKPGSSDTVFAKTSFSIGHQISSNAGASGIGGNVKLMQLGALEKIKADRRACYFRDAHSG